MSYCTSKNIEIARGKAIKILVLEKKPVAQIADRFGVYRSTIWKWCQKWKIATRGLFNVLRFCS